MQQDSENINFGIGKPKKAILHFAMGQRVKCRKCRKRIRKYKMEESLLECSLFFPFLDDSSIFARLANFVHGADDDLLWNRRLAHVHQHEQVAICILILKDE